MLPSYIPLGKYFTELTILSFVISQNHELSLYKTKENSDKVSGLQESWKECVLCLSSESKYKILLETWMSQIPFDKKGKILDGLIIIL